MADLEQIRERVEDLTRRHQKASERKSKLAGKLEEKKAELVKLKQEIEAAGLNPKELKTEKARLEAELEELMETFERELSQVESALNEYEK
jgi:chromosome segregation ATPase